jgi:hypothetical protein
MTRAELGAALKEMKKSACLVSLLIPIYLSFSFAVYGQGLPSNLSCERLLV